MTQAAELIQTLRDLEPTIKQAGQHARELQGSIPWSRKSQTGSWASSVVTQADLDVEKRILAAFLVTPLRHCTLFSEEKTAQTTQFTGDWPFVLSLDPLDSTGTYARGGSYYSVVVTLHDSHNLLYSVKYYPNFDGLLRIVGTTVESKPDWPAVTLDHPELADSAVVHVSTPQPADLDAIQTAISEHGLVLRRTSQVVEIMSTSTLYLMGKVPGYLCGTPNVYDGLTVLHYAQARGHEIISSAGKGQPFKINSTFDDQGTLRYPGYYIALRKDFRG